MRVLAGQTLTDIAIQYLGSPDAEYDIALLNGISVTDDLTPGQELLLPPTVNKPIANYFATKNIQPATEIKVYPQPFDETFDFTF